MIGSHGEESEGVDEPPYTEFTIDEASVREAYGSFPGQPDFLNETESSVEPAVVQINDEESALHRIQKNFASDHDEDAIANRSNHANRDVEGEERPARKKTKKRKRSDAPSDCKVHPRNAMSMDAKIRRGAKDKEQDGKIEGPGLDEWEEIPCGLPGNEWMFDQKDDRTKCRLCGYHSTVPAVAELVSLALQEFGRYSNVVWAQGVQRRYNEILKPLIDGNPEWDISSIGWHFLSHVFYPAISAARDAQILSAASILMQQTLCTRNSKTGVVSLNFTAFKQLRDTMKEIEVKRKMIG